MYRSTMNHHQGSFIHVSIRKGSTSGIILTCFDPQGIVIKHHCYMFRSIRDHHQGSFLDVSIHKGSSSAIVLTFLIHKGSLSGNITTGFDRQGIIISDHSFMFRSTRDHHKGIFLQVSIQMWLSSLIFPTFFDPQTIISRNITTDFHP